ncbi:METTL5 family protein [Halalkalicoccus jeotgali]|uniref:RNA methylase n=1 Tax=Halalkalicoccus jeotgali (strain DSM 18796 / CECT 7217 / JCM 14584 / KCTC 4019 / B3) TaxID=795797 RepID=D8J3W7_HALJB|nr:METTL5 family protein [Halalkalicoccus jeotgali]ADJ15359.1 putative RNA methylase [Halalkalicoccus jeotgali B3]ELY35428.1 putative RNA methylase [Halalkalicoccus jeotgali B3]
MDTKRALERHLSRVRGFDEPRVELEQYPTPAGIAAHLVHIADLRGDLGGTVLDLGTGTGMLALGVALRSPERVIGLDADPAAIETARENARRVDPPRDPDWVLGDGGRPGLCPAGATVLMNPPFGAQRGRRGADRRFLASALDVADVVYSIHNAGSRGFVESFAADRGWRMTHAYGLAFDLDRQFEFHERERTTIEAECYRLVRE